MSDKEVQEAYERAEKNYEMLKDRVHEQYFEIESLKIKTARAIDIIEEMRKDDQYNGIGYELSFLESILKGE